MVTALRGFFASAAAVALLPLCAAAQQPAVVTGHVTGEGGRPIANASVSIQQLGLGSNTRDDGAYTILVPAARVTGEQVTLSVRAINYKPQTAQVTLSQGQLTQDFSLAANPLQLGEVVVTGAGTTSEVEKLGTVRNYVDPQQIQRANEQNLVNSLAAKAPNVNIYSSSGDPGASSYIQVRGITSIESSDGQPLFVIDGVPVANTTDFGDNKQGANGGNIFPPNRLLDINPNDIENVEILKGASSGAIYGSRAGQGVILITTKKGRGGATKYSLRSAWSLEEHTQLPALQSEFGQGTGGVPETCVPSSDPALLNCSAEVSSRSYGPKLAAGTPTFSHVDEIFHNGYTTDNNLTISGGSDKTQFFLAGAYNYNKGIVVGDNNHYRRITVRANGSQQITDRLKAGANIAYSNGFGGFVENRNTTGGLLLGAWRTPPEFNNLPYLDPVFHLHRSYRFPNPGPGSEESTRFYSNPFFTANEQPATSNVARTFGGVNAEWGPTSWLKFNENLGLDYSNDERLQAWPWSTSEGNTPGVNGVGGVSAGYLRNQQVDHNLTGTISYSASKSMKGTITVGQNLNSQTFQSRITLGTGLVAAQPFNLANTSQITTPAFDTKTTVHLESYFGQATLDLADQVFLTAAIRNDGVSTFAESSRRNWFPKGSAAWLFYHGQGENKGFITYGKLRAAYGQSGTQPLPYLLSSTFLGSLITDGGWGPSTSTQINGVGGVISNFKLPTSTLGPERVKEFEAGIDIGLLNDKADLSVTHYRQNSENVILDVPVPTSTGYFNVPENAATLQNRGWEVSLNLRPITKTNFAWDVGLQWARNRGLTTSLPAGLQFAPFPLSGGGNGAGPAVGGAAKVGEPIGVILGSDYVRCGRGLIISGIDIDHTPTSGGGCGTFTPGALYIDATGYPTIDSENDSYVLGDPNPKWTGSVRTNFRLGKVTVGGLLDIRHGGVAYNGTKGALNEFGVGLNTAQGRDGAPVVFGTDAFVNTISHDAVAGPGVGLAVPLDESWWRGAASVFSGIDDAFLEDGGWVKLREVSLGYTIDQPWVSRALGFSSIEVRVAGRNLKSWNNYTGVDPETSLLGAGTPIRGFNYFNNPQTRSWVFTLTLNR
jgi:TonB-linked SusC/RagA family outer membrane protein